MPAKKPETKAVKPAAAKAAPKKAGTKKPAPKKPAASKAGSKKPAAVKAGSKKPAAVKVGSKKLAAVKAGSKKPADIKSKGPKGAGKAIVKKDYKKGALRRTPEKKAPPKRKYIRPIKKMKRHIPSRIEKKALRKKISKKKATGRLTPEDIKRRHKSYQRMKRKPNLGKLKRDPAWWHQHKKNIRRALRPKKYIIDCSLPVTDGIMDAASFEKYFHDNYRLPQGKKGVFGDKLKIVREKSQVIVIPNKILVSKVYMKFIVRKYLRLQQLTDWVRVVASTRDTLQMRYYNIQEAGDEGDDDEDDEDER